MTTVTISEVSRDYGAERPAVDNISLQIESGEFFTLLGPSGCGKTTTLRMIAGFELPTAGAIQFDGADVTTRAPEKRDIGMVFQNYALFPHLTVSENVGYGLRLRRVDTASGKERIGAALEQVGLSSFGGRRIGELSGGQQQRVALARALVIRPRVLLLDEPLSNLDARLRDETRVQLRTLQKQANITSVYVTHDQAEALAVSDRIAVLEGGRVHQVGTPREVYAKPATAFVARFIGRSNLISGRIQSLAASSASIELESGTNLTVRRNDVHLEAGGEVQLAIRPEQLSLSDATTGRGIPGVIEDVEYQGGHTNALVATAAGTQLHVTVPETGLSSALPTAGEAVRVDVGRSAAWPVRS